MNFEHLFEDLKEFGFNSYESKVLSYLLLRKEATAPEMSKNLDIPNTKIYYVLDKLILNGFIKKRSFSPTIYYLENPSDFFDKILFLHKKRYNYLVRIKDRILNKISFSSDTKVFLSKSEFLYYLSVNLTNINIVCSKECKKYIDYIKNKNYIVSVLFCDFPIFVLHSNEIFLFCIFNRDDFVVGFVTSECLDKFRYFYCV